ATTRRHTGTVGRSHRAVRVAGTGTSRASSSSCSYASLRARSETYTLSRSHGVRVELRLRRATLRADQRTRTTSIGRIVRRIGEGQTVGAQAVGVIEMRPTAS